jgi:hypothetical protein
MAAADEERKRGEGEVPDGDIEGSGALGYARDDLRHWDPDTPCRNRDERKQRSHRWLCPVCDADREQRVVEFAEYTRRASKLVR